RLVSGRADINGTNVSVSGEALTGVAANEIRTRMENSLPSGYSGKADLTVRTVAEFVTPEACQAALTAIMEKDTIQFESGKSAIKSDSFGLLDRLAFEARRCPQQKIEIGGHTDSDGSEEANIKLSQERSNAVRDYLVRSGVLFSRLIAKGYGEADPVADNSTAEGKAKNRRIDFRILN
ncbi:MAG: OmpA family protein, partial [Nitratireductor sp.]|nr:OmpA family protein [Nitratireductor sp.]